MQTSRAARITLGVMVVLAFAGVAFAASAPAPIYWTPSQTGQALKAQGTLIMSVVAYGNGTIIKAGLAYVDPQSGRVTFTGFSSRASIASCRGFGTRHKTGFAAFQCQAQWSSPNDVSHTVYHASLWVRPLPWRASSRYTRPTAFVCTSARTLADCPPPLPAHPKANDPRICPSDCNPEQNTGNFAGAAGKAVEAQLRANGINSVANFGCLAVTTFVYRCSWNLGANAGTVAFVQGKTAWTTTVTLG